MNQYRIAHTTALRALETLERILIKTSNYSKEKGIDEKELINKALYPDMFNFIKQVQVATDDARRNLCFLAGREHVRMEDNETTIAELHARIAKTRDVINAIDLSLYDGADERKISLFWMGEAYVLGKDFVTEFAIPNLMFHVVTAYGIMRANGVPLGKTDFVGHYLSMKQG